MVLEPDLNPRDMTAVIDNQVDEMDKILSRGFIELKKGIDSKKLDPNVLDARIPKVKVIKDKDGGYTVDMSAFDGMNPIDMSDVEIAWGLIRSVERTDADTLHKRHDDSEYLVPTSSATANEVDLNGDGAAMGVFSGLKVKVGMDPVLVIDDDGQGLIVASAKKAGEYLIIPLGILFTLGSRIEPENDGPMLHSNSAWFTIDGSGIELILLVLEILIRSIELSELLVPLAMLVVQMFGAF